MDLKNLKIEDLKPLIMQYADKKTLIKIGISAGAVIFFLIIYQDYIPNYSVVQCYLWGFEIKVIKGKC